MTNTNRPIRRALVSVFHKEGIEVLADAFVKAGTEVVSTGSTAKKLAELGVHVTEVSDVTGFPECLDGRVKTLHPYIHAGILADMTNPEHAKQLEEFGIKPFDLVVVNLYPFADTVRSGANEAVFSNRFYLEITHRGCNKGGMVARLLEMLHIPRENLYCVGDNQNDIPMMALSAIPFAPANCAQEVKDWGATILCHCDDGVIGDIVDRLDRIYPDKH